MTCHRAVALACLLLATLPACSEKHYYSVDLAGNSTRVDADGHPLAGATLPAAANPHAGMPGAPGENPHGAAAAGQPAKGPITGTIELDSKLGLDASKFACVFIIARRADDGQMDGVSQIRKATLPATFQLAPADGQHGGGLSDGPHVLTVRLDADGDAGATPGDVEAVLDDVLPGGPPVTVRLDHVLTADEIASRKPVAVAMPPAGGGGAAPFAPFAGGAGAAATPEDLAGPRFKGRLELGPEFAALDGKYPLFIIVRSTSTGGAPLLAKAVMAARFPLTFDIGTENAPNKTDDMAQILAGDVKIYARLAVSGDAKGGAGDIEATPQIVRGNGPSLVLRLDQRRAK